VGIEMTFDNEYECGISLPALNPLYAYP